MHSSNTVTGHDYLSVGNLNPDLIIINQNIRSLRSNFDEFVVFRENLKRKPDIIILTEIWIKDTEICQYMLPNYTTNAQCNNKYCAGG